MCVHMQQLDSSSSTNDITHVRCPSAVIILSRESLGQSYSPTNSVIVLTDSYVLVSHYTHGRNLHLSEGRHEAGDLPVVLAVHLSPMINQQTNHIEMAT